MSKPPDKIWYRMLDLRRELRWANATYYFQYDGPEAVHLSDADFDKRFKQLERLEAQYEDWLDSWGWDYITRVVNGHTITLPMIYRMKDKDEKIQPE